MYYQPTAANPSTSDAYDTESTDTEPGCAGDEAAACNTTSAIQLAAAATEYASTSIAEPADAAVADTTTSAIQPALTNESEALQGCLEVSNAFKYVQQAFSIALASPTFRKGDKGMLSSYRYWFKG